MILDTRLLVTPESVALNRISEEYGGFHHNEQSVRVVERLEKDGKGLNLTAEVRDGILNHQTSLMPYDIGGKDCSPIGQDCVYQFGYR